MSTANSMTASIAGEVTYTDGTKSGFGASIDDAGNIEHLGDSTGFGDAITRIKALFVAMSGVLTSSPVGTAKVVNDMELRFEGDCTIGDGVKYAFAATYTAKTGTLVSSGAAAAYAIFKAKFKPELQDMLAAIAGVSATIS